jgi:ABC-type branched-subunit amino acid transport system ATPase component
MTLLSVDSVDVRFGGVHALRACTFDVQDGECVGLVGPNGAGKSTLMNAVSGLARVSGGRITLGGGTDLTALPAWRRHRVGISRTFQLARQVADIKVLDYVVSGQFDFTAARHLAGMLRTPGYLRAERARAAKARDLLAELDLAGYADLPQREVPLGARRLVDLARALMSAPTLLMMDEVVAGLDEHEARRIAAIVRAKRDEGMTILLIEHDIGFVRDMVDSVVVLAEGAVLCTGSPHDVLTRQDVVESFVGPTGTVGAGHG